jgi:hypothetical protein
MDPAKPELMTGVVKAPRSLPGMVHCAEADVEMKDGPARRLTWNVKTRLISVYDENNGIIGWTERRDDGSREVVLADGRRPGVLFKGGLFSFLFSYVWIGGKKFKSVMSLEGSTRVFGDDRLRVEHRDFKSEVRFRCLPELEVAAIITAFEVYWSKISGGTLENE